MTNLEELEALIRRNLSLAEARVDTRSLGQWKQALELVEAMGWLDIETAPKDGTKVLTCILADGISYSVTVNVWNDPSKTNLGRLGWWYSRPSRKPTHWTPIP